VLRLHRFAKEGSSLAIKVGRRISGVEQALASFRYGAFYLGMSAQVVLQAVRYYIGLR
jgi:hypothetical protein